MNYESEAGWQLHPLDGATGKAFMGTKNEEKLFLKKNTSPFLAALSLEGISPRLVWTKRMGNGDVLTAQEWCNGRTLKRDEMNSLCVAQKLHQIHHSSALKKMLLKVEGRYLLPSDLLNQFFMNLSPDLKIHPTIKAAGEFVLNWAKSSQLEAEVCVCHGDASHKNWLLSDFDDLYLVDWDSVALADPAYDIGQYLSRYNQQIDSKDWLNHYSSQLTDNFKDRVYWYQVMTSLLDIKDLHLKRRLGEMNQAIQNLVDIINERND